MKYLFTLLSIFFLASCVTGPSPQLKKTYFHTWPIPNEISAPRRSIQVITAEFNNKKHSIEAVLDFSKNEMILSFIVPIWPQPLKVNYDEIKIVADQNIKKRFPMDLEYLITDIILVYTSADLLKKKLDANVAIEEKSMYRTISVGNKEIYQIHYSNKDKVNADVELKNLKHNYRLEIKVQQQESQ